MGMTETEARNLNARCLSCPYAQWKGQVDGGTETELECDPPMGECPAEFPEPERQGTPGLCIVNGEEAMRHFPVEDY